MSYMIQTFQGYASPVIICDQCSEQILYGKEGNALWRASVKPESAIDNGCKIFHTHKTCNHAFEVARPPRTGEFWMSHELNHHLWMLAQNCGYSAKAGKAQNAALDALC